MPSSHYSGLWQNIPRCLPQIQMGLAGHLPPFETRKIRQFEVERIFLENKKMVDVFRLPLTPGIRIEVQNPAEGPIKENRPASVFSSVIPIRNSGKGIVICSGREHPAEIIFRRPENPSSAGGYCSERRSHPQDLSSFRKEKREHPEDEIGTFVSEIIPIPLLFFFRIQGIIKRKEKRTEKEK